MIQDEHSIIDGGIFERIRNSYSASYPAALCVTNVSGEIVQSSPNFPGLKNPQWQHILTHVIAEALRWGEPTIYDQPEGFIIWAMPIMINARLVGGLVACCREETVFGDNGQFKFNLKKACGDLLEICVQENITNSAMLAEHREIHLREQKRAEAIHEMKSQTSRDILERYLLHEPEIISAIKRGNRHQAVEIINSTLAEIYHMGGERLDIIKSLVMELVVTMCRAAIASGGATIELLGANYSSLTELAAINHEEALARWVVDMLNRIMDSIEINSSTSSSNDIEMAIDFIQKNHGRHITREEAAEQAGMSESHFARLLKDKTGLSFTDMLNRVRLDKAAELLRKTDMGIMQIAMETGFADQSYFTRVFRKNFKLTPGQYRKKHSKML